MTSPSHVPAPSPPARIAAYLGALLGVALVGAGVFTFAQPRPPPLALSVALVMAGGLDLALAWFLLRLRRVAWAFSASLNGTGFVVFLFGSFKLRDMLEWPLAAASIPFVLFGVVSVLLGVAYEEFEK